MSRFLIIDDDPIICQIFKSYFSSKGNYVETAKDGRDGVAKFKASKFDLVVTDLMMPVVHGFEVIDTIKSSFGGNDNPIPIILLTADKEEPNLKRYPRRHQQDDTLEKPFDMPDLEKKIKFLLK